MKISYKIIALFSWVSFLFSVVANAGNDRIVFTEHNGNTDANSTEFTLDGSSSEGDIISWQWDQISGPYIEEFTDSNGNGIWDPSEELTDSNENGVWDEEEEFIDSNENGVWDEEEEFIDSNGNGIWDDAENFTDSNENGSCDFEPVEIQNNTSNSASFESAVEYGGNDKIYTFELTVENLNGDSDSDLVQFTIKAEQNLPPIITLQNLDFIPGDVNFDGEIVENNSIYCGGSSDGAEDGFECVLFFLDLTYIESIIDPDDDTLSFEWLNNNGPIPNPDLYSILFSSSEPHYLYLRATDSYNDYSEIIIIIYSSIDNSYPIISFISLDDTAISGSFIELDEEIVYTISAEVLDEEHALNDIEIEWSCTDESIVLSNQIIDTNSGIVSIDFQTPFVQNNADLVEFSIQLIALDPYQQFYDDAPISSATMTVHVNNINQPPEITGYSPITANEDEYQLIQIGDIEFVDEDNFDDDISLEIYPGVDYDYNQNYIRPTTELDVVHSIDVNIRINDGEEDNNFSFENDGAYFHLPIQVTPVNDAPSITASTNLFTLEDQEIPISIEDLDIIDPDSDLFNLIIINESTLNYSINDNIIIPTPDFFGDIITQVQVSDEEGENSELSNILDISIEVIPINDSPVSIYDNESFDLFLDEDFGDSLLLNYNNVFSDIDDNSLFFDYSYENDSSIDPISIIFNDDQDLFISSIDNMNSLQENGDFTSLTIIPSATDTSNLSAQNIFDIIVLPKNDPPTFFSGTDSLGMTYIDEGEQTFILIDLTSPESQSGEADYSSPYADDIEDNNWYYQIDIDSDGIIDDIDPLSINMIPTDNGHIDAVDSTSFHYYPNPGFRCIDRFEIQVKDDGVDYDETLISFSSPRTSNVGMVEIIVDFCNLAPEFISYDQENVSSIDLYEDDSLNINEINLDFFAFEDPNIAEDFDDIDGNGIWDEGETFIDSNGNNMWDDADEVISLHAIIWNDFGEDGIENTGDFGENDGLWNKGEGWRDCGTDGLCPEDIGYFAPDYDNTEFNGEWNQGEEPQNLKYSVSFECSLAYTNQDDCEYDGGIWSTTIFPLTNYNGPLNVAIQGNDGEESHNLSSPFIVGFYVLAVNDAPIITNAFLSDIDGNPIEIFNNNEIDTLDYVFEDTLNVQFNVLFEDIDSDLDLNETPFDTDELYWLILSPSNVDNQSFYGSFKDDEDRFYIDSLRPNWNGTDDILIEVRDLSNALGQYYFTLTSKPINDVPYDFSVDIYENESFPDTSLFEDDINLNEKIIRYSISYEDIDRDPNLNQYEDYEFEPDNLTWIDDYQGENFDFEMITEIDYESDIGNLKYIRNIQYSSLRENWNGYDSIPIYLKAVEFENNLDSILLPLEVLPLNDVPIEFEIYPILRDYAMDETAFYIPCLEEDEECVEIIHGIEFGQEDNFFRLHNEEDIEASVNYNDFNAGKLLFKWDRTYDVDLDGLISEYYQPDLLYRIELIAQDEVFTDTNGDGDWDDGEPLMDTNNDGIWTVSDGYHYVLGEVNDSIFNNENLCNEITNNNSMCSDPYFSFMNDSDFGWTIIDLRNPFLKYQEGFYDNPDIESGENGFYTSPNFNQDNYNYDYIDYYGTTQYEWRVVAYNSWWDYNSNTDNYINTEMNGESDQMRFFIDLIRPSANFSIIQNPLFLELYELYIMTNEEIDVGESKLYINESPFILSSFGEDSYDVFYYAGEFDNSGVYDFELRALDLLENGGISNYSITYSYAIPGMYAAIQSPNNIAELIIPDYALSQPTSFIISENQNLYEDINMVSISDIVEISTSNLSLQSPILLRFINNFDQIINQDNIRIGQKNQFGDWVIMDSRINSNFIELDISTDGSYTVFYIEEVGEVLPENFELLGCYPNPFNPNISIEFTLPNASYINLSIYDITGKKVKSLINNEVDPGYININWNGINEAGNIISSGIYFVILEKDNERFINKITMMK